MYRRIPLLVIGLLAFLALSSSSAFAAGKPIISSFESPYENGGGLAWGTLNSKELLGGISPNGASTTYKIEYSTSKTLAESESTSEINIGSGTSVVGLKANIKGLFPNTQYYVRLVAKNSFGTTTSSIIELMPESKGRWVTANFKSKPAAYAAKGSFVINFPGLAEIICSSNGYGTLGNTGGIGDAYSIYTNSCGVYFSGKKTCTATIPALNLNERLIFGSGVFTVNIPESCPFFGGSIKLPVKEPFTATKVGWEGAVELPIQLQSTTAYSTYSGTIKDTSTWSLVGVNEGIWFNIEYAL
jgi:hypothetical protein